MRVLRVSTRVLAVGESASSSWARVLAPGCQLGESSAWALAVGREC